MTMVLLHNALNSIIFNITANEMAKMNKYSYLKNRNGRYKNIFSKGIFYNIKYYFHLIQPNQLETINYKILNDEV